MLRFNQFVSELAREDVRLSPSELEQMKSRFGENVLQMGHLEQDGSMNVPVDCVLEAARSLDSRTLTEAAESINGEDTAFMLHSGEALIQRIVEARERKLRQAIQAFQNERDASKSEQEWKQIEKEVFGVEYRE